MYVDDQGVIKDLPVNHRASQIAQMCGLLLEVRGDAFVARFIDNDDDFVRLDFPLSDLSSSASWVAEARRFHESKRRRGGDEMAAFERLVGGRSAGPGKSGSSVKIKEESEAER